jgi:hypothetical protein
LPLIGSGGLNSTISALSNPSTPDFKGEYRCIASDLRNANSGQSFGPLEIDHPWDAYIPWSDGKRPVTCAMM